MHIDAECKGIIPIYSERGVFEALVKGISPIKIIGGGSNILLSGNQDAYILKNEIKGIQIIDEDEHEVMVNVGAGENWHNLVLWSISHNLGGIENLALIPGSVGAAPIQNIGAYGVEQDSVFHSLKAIDLEEGTTKLFFREDCKFGYRDSIFKKEVKGRYFITHVNYIFSKQYETRTSYGAINTKLEERNITSPTSKDISEIVIEIRQSKLPDPAVIPNTGSFFKNPILSASQFDKVLASFPDIVSYPLEDGSKKIPAAWLIEQSGYKGKRNGDAGTHKNHALVLVNHGKATGKELMAFAKEIQGAVLAKFGISLEPEVNIW